MRFVSAHQKGRGVICTADDGTQIKYSGGDPAWRTNNPGNLWPGAVSKRNNAIGKFDSFVIFPDYATGHAALIDSKLNLGVDPFAGGSCLLNGHRDAKPEISVSVSWNVPGALWFIGTRFWRVAPFV